jgi:8-oxo-dGTP diphosphatase
MANEDRFHLGIKALIRNQENKILLLKVNVKSLRNYNGDAYWDIPGGRIQKDDTVESTLLREIDEETGIKQVKNFSFFSATLSNIRIPLDNESVGLILFAYLCDTIEINEIKLSSEHVCFDWFTPAQAAQLLKVKYPNDFVEKLCELDQPK